ncbi:dTDP-4-dehydrorhamnose 3,5-epimerase [Tsuneonella mangrovi]|uniref:dTDP-4-dehydrorhamnose 3,5-epimerase n=1 Tax=Tsuneonella mangrovi TaxID=1982042 RepID=UPI000BA22AA6|nr:dTDP-4-dehydrorhamnose 3,5-epimerase [Tsuneonella mangrovi]
MADAGGPVRLLVPDRHCDARGWFEETYNQRILAECGIVDAFVQDNQSFSAVRHTLRGIHFQAPPHAQAKLVRCVNGRIFDVAVDLRDGSPTFGKWVGAELSRENGAQLYIPAGFGHAFLTLEPDCDVAYKVSAFHSDAAGGGLAWNDPDIAIDWPGLGPGAAPIVSAKDAAQPLLAQFESAFRYDGQPLVPLAPGCFGNV